VKFIPGQVEIAVKDTQGQKVGHNDRPRFVMTADKAPPGIKTHVSIEEKERGAKKKKDAGGIDKVELLQFKPHIGRFSQPEREVEPGVEIMAGLTVESKKQGYEI
jgi:hypothetical protein